MNANYDAQAEIAELYDHVPLYKNRRDAAFYVDLCRAAKGEVLELGCGTGRILIRAAQAGCTITGLDQSGFMLERCRSKMRSLASEVHRRVTLVEADMTNFSLGHTFALATVPFRPLQHLVSVEEQLGLLDCVRRHLMPGGKLALDVFHPDLKRLASPATPEEIEDTAEHTLADGRRLRRTFRLTAKRIAGQINDAELIYYLQDQSGSTTRIVHAFPLRYFFRFELEHLLARAGFEIAEFFGDFDRSPFTDSSPEMIVIAARKD
jgi:SAM-dependent methyltransferase